MQQTSTQAGVHSAQGAHIAQSQLALVDQNNVIEVERVDTESLPKKPAYTFIKRSFDIVACSCALVALSPVMLATAVVVKLDSPGPAIFTQERLGKNGKPFHIHKFRSMRIDAESNGAQWAVEEDARVTRVGSFLRKSRLDELPQFYDVVIGNMSLIGPRPERAVFYEEFEKYIHGFSQRLLVRPGITGLAQVSGGYDLKPAEKIIYDLKYIKEQDIWMDIKIIGRTIGVLFTHDGAR